MCIIFLSLPIFPDDKARTQTENKWKRVDFYCGTIFYFKSIPPARSYVKIEGKEIHFSLPEGDLLCIGARGDAVYFDLNEKEFHKAVFSPTDGLHEKLQFDGKCIREKNGDKYSYRMWDADRDGQEIEEVNRLKKWIVHSGIGFYLSQTPEATGLSVHVLSKASAVIEAPDRRIVKKHSPDYNGAFLYLAYGSDLIVLNTETMEFLPSLAVGDIDYIADIVRVRDGMITLRTHSNGEFFLISAKLPKSHVA